MHRHRWQSISIAAGLVALNIAVMYLLSYTALTSIVARLFNTLIIGVLLFGALLTGGAYLAERGVKDGNTGRATIGVLLLQAGYGMFGGFALAFAPASVRLTATVIAAAASILIAAMAAAYVSYSDRDFSRFRRYASYCFLGVLLMAFLGTFSPPLALAGFLLALTGFLFYLVYEIADLHQHPSAVLLNGIGIYTAFMGVFIHILQIVIRLFGRRQ